ncbi:MAG: hypothetical protein ABI882_04195 [Acidobacteriota bacterium]
MLRLLVRSTLIVAATCAGISLVFAQAMESTFEQKSRTTHTPGEFRSLTANRVRLFRSATLVRKDGTLVGGPDGVVRRSASGGLAPFPARLRLPVNEITVIAEERPGLLWFGSRHGAILLHEATGEVEYFAGRRWLPDDHVTGIGFDKGEHQLAIWIETSRGFSKIVYSATTLEAKTRGFEERIQARHNRHGLTADSHLTRPGDLTSNQMVSSDNDGLWTAMYVAAEAFRFHVTHSTEARDFARQGMRAIIRLESISGIPGFPARSFIKIGVDQQPGDGEWHTTPDAAWKWKGDTSSDEIVGHYFVYGLYYDLVADETEKQEIRALVERMTSHIVDHNYQLIDLDGVRTRWGWWGPETIWEDPDETGLRALHILSHLQVAIHITGNPKFTAAYDDLVKKHRYHLLVRNQKISIPGRVNHSDDELAFLSYYPLLRYEKNPDLIKVYRESLERSWQVERAERSPLWNFIYAAGTGEKEYDRELSIRTLREIPVDLVSWTVTNSHRLDLALDPASDRFGRRQSALTVLPYDELPMMKWNGSPYRLDGGNNGRSEDDGAYFLLPYWMGRFHGLVDK